MFDCGVKHRLSGDVFADGHCTREVVSELDRATWALVACDQDGTVTEWVGGLVPSYYPQTPQAGEFFAALNAVKLCDRGSTLYDDCQNVVDQFSEAPSKW